MTIINYTVLATGALGFTVALAWNSAVSKTIDSFFPRRDGAGVAHATIVYAIVVTILVIVVAAGINHAQRIYHEIKVGNAKGSKTKENDNSKDSNNSDCVLPSHCSGHRNKFDSSGAIIQLWKPPQMARRV